MKLHLHCTSGISDLTHNSYIDYIDSYIDYIDSFVIPSGGQSLGPENNLGVKHLPEILLASISITWNNK